MPVPEGVVWTGRVGERYFLEASGLLRKEGFQELCTGRSGGGEGSTEVD